MPTNLALSKKLVQRSDRVKSVDMHPTEPWVLCGLYTGKAVIYNYNTNAVVKSIDVSELPVRCAKFIPRKQWVIMGSDDMQIRVFNYNTQERLVAFEGHSDYIRHLEVHPTQPYVITCSDDMTAKLWDWEKGWACVQTYEGHMHYVMMARINPKDTNTFATASLDCTIKVWSLSSPQPNFSLDGHAKGVNCVDYYPGGDKPYIVSGADDQTLRIWDYQTRSCVSTLEGHTNNVCAVAFHPRLPLIISASEDGTVRVWHNTTYRLETTLNYGMERAWTVAVTPGNNKVALGYDEGTIVVKLGREVPIASLDRNGKLVVARNNVIFSASLRAASSLEDEDEGAGGGGAGEAAAGPVYVDGERINIPEKELGAVELFPQSIVHNANGRFLAVCGDNEFVIYTSQALRNKSFGGALDFVWSSSGVGDYAVRESTSRVKIFRNFKETSAFKPPISAEGLSGGALVGVRSSDTVCFYEWDTGRMIRRIEVGARALTWNDHGDLVAIASDEAFYVLRFSREAVAAADAAALASEEGIEAAFELQHEVSDKVQGGVWVGDCYVYTNASNRLNYYVGGEVITLAHLDRRMYVLGYLAKEGRVFLMDKAGVITSYALCLAVLEYQTVVVRRDFASANRILADVPKEHLNAIAKFLEAQGFKEQALAVATDPDVKFDLAVQLGKLDMAQSLLRESSGSSSSSSSSSSSGAAGTGAGAGGDASGENAETAAKWKQLLDLALATSNLDLAEECALAAGELGTLLLLYTATGNTEGLLRLGAAAEEGASGNVAFLAYHSAGSVAGCARALAASGQSLEAEIYAKVYAGAEAVALGAGEGEEEAAGEEEEAAAGEGEEEEEEGGEGGEEQQQEGAEGGAGQEAAALEQGGQGEGEAAAAEAAAAVEAAEVE